MNNGIVEFSTKEKEELRFQAQKYKVHLCSRIYKEKEECDNCHAYNNSSQNCIVSSFLELLDRKES